MKKCFYYSLLLITAFTLVTSFSAFILNISIIPLWCYNLSYFCIVLQGFFEFNRKIEQLKYEKVGDKK